MEKKATRNRKSHYLLPSNHTEQEPGPQQCNFVRVEPGSLSTEAPSNPPVPCSGLPSDHRSLPHSMCTQRASFVFSTSLPGAGKHTRHRQASSEHRNLLLKHCSGDFCLWHLHKTMNANGVTASNLQYHGKR